MPIPVLDVRSLAACLPALLMGPDPNFAFSWTLALLTVTLNQSDFRRIPAMPEPTPSHSSADRNLLFGILALQMDFINREALIQAMHAWVLAKAKPLGQILQEQRALRADA